MSVGAVFAVAVLTIGVAGASANTVVNGDFETGDFEGWTLVDEPQPPTGSWIVYSASEPFLPPPQGGFAAVTTQGNPGTHILYQDVPIEAGEPYLSMTVFYDSSEAITVPNPDTLEAGEEGDGNQQYRIEILDPTAQIDSVDPTDILATVFRTLNGDPDFVGPRKVGIDLSAFAGQTVRLRLAEVDDLGELNAGVDSIATGQVPPPAPSFLPAPPTQPSNAFTFGKLKLNKKNGTATLKVSVPGAGTLTAKDAKKKAPKRIRKTTAAAAGAGVATLRLKATKAGKRKLKESGKLQFKLSVTFTPTGGAAAAQTFSGKLKLTLPPQR
jgi:hypothetical protein